MQINDSFINISTGLQLLSDYSIFWLPIVLIIIAWFLWVHYIQTLFISKMKWVLFEVRIPRDVYKSPLAMEMVLINAFHQTGGTGTWFAKWWEGKVRMWFSLEIVSLEGKIYFFIRVPEAFKKLTESQIYAQYPRAEITEVSDYTKMVPVFTKDGDFGVWGCEFILSKHDAYPIKTYVDYGLDKAIGTLEEEQRVDPITSMIESIASIGEGEQIWVQILIRASTDRYDDPKKWFGKRGWKDEGRSMLEELLKSYKGEKDKPPSKIMTKGVEENIKSIERHLNKLGFDCGMRAIYIAKKDQYNGVHAHSILSSIRQYNSGEMNGFRPTNVTGFDYPWQDRTGSKTAQQKTDLIKAYKARSYFYPPYNKAYTGSLFKTGRKPFVLSSEELATVFHFPGKVSETPSFKRIESKTSEPPANLPI